MTARSITQYFSNASNANFHNTTFTHVSGDAYITNSERYGLKLLLDNISTGAFHDAAERGDPPRCHPHTREAIRAEIMEWIQGSDVGKLILWMYGPAGSGKTAIAQSIADECQRQGLLAASFFFGRTAAGRKDSTHFVATIAYQLFQSIPQIRDQITLAVEQNATIFSRALATQMQVLLIKPLKSLPASPKPIFVITDGVDECGPDRQSQAILLNTLGNAILELQHIRLILLVASRPEYEIREAFNGDLLSSFVKSLVLDDTYKPDDDIRRYLNSMFQDIHAKHLRLGSYLPSPWPATIDVNHILFKASGQFIFASTLIKFIDSSRHNAQERLEIILGMSAPGNETPFALLDALYHFIISSVADLQKVLKILTLLMLADYKDSDAIWSLSLTIGVVEAIVGFAIGPVLVDMHALLFVPPPTDRKSILRIHHASLYDYLTNRTRSHNHYIDITQGHNTLSQCWLSIMTKYPCLPAPLSLPHCVNGFVTHCRKITTFNDETVRNLASFSLRKLLGEICGFKDLRYPRWNDFFQCVEKRSRAYIGVFPRLRDEFDAFVFERLSRYPPALQALIPTIIVHGSSLNKSTMTTVPFQTRHIFNASLYALYSSETNPQVADIRSLDQTMLGLDQIIESGYTTVFGPLFQDRSRAGKFFVDHGSYATLAKQLVQGAGLLQHGSDSPIPDVIDYRHCSWFPSLIEMASEDLELAALLRDHVLQYKIHSLYEGAPKIAKISLEYIQDCRIPYLKHTHLPNTDRCIICIEYGSASMVVDTLPSPISEPLPKAGFVRHLKTSVRDRIGSVKFFKR